MLHATCCLLLLRDVPNRGCPSAYKFCLPATKRCCRRPRRAVGQQPLGASRQPVAVIVAMRGAPSPSVCQPDTELSPTLPVSVISPTRPCLQSCRLKPELCKAHSTATNAHEIRTCHPAGRTLSCAKPSQWPSTSWATCSTCGRTCLLRGTATARPLLSGGLL